MLPKDRPLSRNTIRFAILGALLALAGMPSLAQNLSGPPVAPSPAAGTPPAADTPSNPPPGAAVQSDSGRSDGVAAVVNDAIITEYDLHQRILLYVSTSGQQPTPDVIAKLRPQILAQLETEQIEIQEARHKNITVSPTDVDKSIERITSDNHLTKEQLADLLAKGGVHMATLRAQIAVQIAWQKTVQDEFQDRINITPQDIDAEMARQMQGINKTHYQVSSIFLAVENPDLDAKVLKDAQDIHAQLASGANFGTVARQFSQSPTAAAGGDLGWVYEGQLPSELDAALHKMDIGQVTEPICSTGGYYIMGLRDRAVGANVVVPDPATLKPVGPLTVAQILLPMPPNTPAQYRDNAMKLATQIHDHINGCDTLPKLASEIHGLVYSDLKAMGLKISDLSPTIQDAINKAGPGEATVPIVAPTGILMMVRCDKRAPEVHKVNLPTRQQVEENLFDDQITMLSRRYIRDLRRNANVETK